MFNVKQLSIYRPNESLPCVTERDLRNPTPAQEPLESVVELERTHPNLCGELLKAFCSCFCLSTSRERRSSDTRTTSPSSMGSSRENKLVVLGPGGVGKTSLVVQYLEGFFTTTYKPTVEDYYRHTIKMPVSKHHDSLLILKKKLPDCPERHRDNGYS
ncbi:uncharacterized protein TNIN_494251 [Trichonephila inaurata madagascariensis]|uniref:Uncharacterized protein n=1 Tax=Trichonephila inaurata madagascariensis TaxID=2747483 RepID=A0A8X6XNJ5_9ARAC|nr:uncharacterized protein TNIN_494251 [Trichonephila inaurata madagascariensis]